MSEKPLPKKSGSISMGAVGLVFTIIFSIRIVLSPGVASVFLGGALGSVGLVISIVGIAKGVWAGGGRLRDLHLPSRLPDGVFRSYGYHRVSTRTF